MEYEPKTKTLTWQLLTTADVEITKAGAILKQDGKDLVINNLTHPDIKFDVISLDPPPFELDKRIENLKRIELRISADKNDEEIKIKISLSGPNKG